MAFRSYICFFFFFLPADELGSAVLQSEKRGMKGGMERAKEKGGCSSAETVLCGCVRGRGCSCIGTLKNASVSPPSGRHQKCCVTDAIMFLSLKKKIISLKIAAVLD